MMKLGASTVAAPKTNNAAYNKDFKVYGVLNDGKKVLLAANTEYTVKSSLAGLAADAADGVIDANGLAVAYDTANGKTEKTETITVTINNTGKEVTKNVTFSKVAPKVTSIRAYDNATDNNTITTFTAPTSTVTFATIAGNVEVTDQYGVKVKLTGTNDAFLDGTAIAAPTLTITPVTGTVALTSNGLAGATVNGLDSSESVSAKIVYGDANTVLTITR